MWFNEPFAVSPYRSLYWDMHGLIFETSIWLPAGSTGLYFTTSQGDRPAISQACGISTEESHQNNPAPPKAVMHQQAAYLFKAKVKALEPHLRFRCPDLAWKASEFAAGCSKLKFRTKSEHTDKGVEKISLYLASQELWKHHPIVVQHLCGLEVMPKLSRDCKQ